MLALPLLVLLYQLLLILVQLCVRVAADFVGRLSKILAAHLNIGALLAIVCERILLVWLIGVVNDFFGATS